MDKLALGKRLYRFAKPTLLTEEGAKLPEAYKKFFLEWKSTPSPVHYRPIPSKWIRDEDTGEVKRVENVPIPLLFPPESHKGIWGGEAVIKGFQKRNRYKAKVPHFWIPNLKKSAVYSEVLNKTMSVTVTERTIDLIIQNNGFDNYLLKTPACDLQSGLALKLKRKILQALLDKSLYPDNKQKREEVYNKYKHYLEAYTPEEIEWYGLTFDEALIKQKKIEEAENAPVPLKHQFRRELILKLMEERTGLTDELPQEKESSWVSRLNPFGKKKE